MKKLKFILGLLVFTSFSAMAQETPSGSKSVQANPNTIGTDKTTVSKSYDASNQQMNNSMKYSTSQGQQIVSPMVDGNPSPANANINRSRSNIKGK